MKLQLSRKAINVIILALSHYISRTANYNDKNEAMVIRHKLTNL